MYIDIMIPNFYNVFLVEANTIQALNGNKPVHAKLNTTTLGISKERFNDTSVRIYDDKFLGFPIVIDETIPNGRILVELV